MPDLLANPQASRRALLAGLALALATGIGWRRMPPGLAQEATPQTVGTPESGAGMIRSTGVGEVPSSGASRPGPAGRVQDPASGDVVAPVGLSIASAGVDASIEALRVVDGAMQDPSGPWVVAWYENLGSLGELANVVMAGHIDYWNVGPSVFYNLANVRQGDEIVVAGDDGKLYPFTVEWIQQFDSASMPLDDVTGSTGQQSLTLITCGGAFDFANGQYLQRTVVRANRGGPGLAAAA